MTLFTSLINAGIRSGFCPDLKGLNLKRRMDRVANR